MHCSQLCHSSGEMQSQSNAIEATLKAEVINVLTTWSTGPGCCDGQPCAAELETREHHMNTTVLVGGEEKKEFFWLENTVLKTKQE